MGKKDRIERNAKKAKEQGTTRKIKRKGKKRRDISPEAQAEQNEFLRQMGMSPRRSGPRKRSRKEIRMRLIREQKAREATQRARAITRGNEEAREKWADQPIRHNGNIHVVRGKARKERENTIAQERDKTYAAWDAEYGQN